MKQKEVRIKVCSCGKDLKIEDVKYIGKMQSPKKIVHLFNCKHCNTTLSLKEVA